jgi:hypothetical protein
VTRKVFYKLLGAFSLLLIFHAVAMEAIFHQIVETSAVNTLPVLRRFLWRCRWRRGFR